MINKLKLLFCLSLIIALGSLHAQTAVDTYGQLSVSGTQVKDQNNNDVQLMGMSLFWSQWEPEYYTHNTVEWLRDDWCINIIRAAMAVESQGYLTNPSEEEAKVRTVIQAAIDLGIYVIVDWHDHHADEHQDEAITFFSKIAEDYGQYPNIIYEIFNEPLNNVSWNNTLKPYHEAVISAIRQHDSNNIIVCGTPKWSQNVDEASLNPLSGNNIAYTLHYYAGTHGASLRSQAETAMNNGLCLFVTEYGTVNADGDGDVATSSSQTWYDWMAQHKISHCNWSIADKVEGASAITPNTSPNGNWTANNLTTSGAFVRSYIKSNCPTYTYPSTPPSITAQPQGITMDAGESTTLSVEASGTDLKYQWYKDGEKIDQATSSSFPITNSTTNNEGEYYVVITNDHGTATSNIVSVNIYGGGQEPYQGSPIQIPGTIQAQDYDLGGAGVAYSDSDDINEGETYRTDGVDIETTEDNTGDYNLGWTNLDEWVEYTIEVAEDGQYNFEFRVASNGEGGAISLDIDGTFLLDQTIPNTNGWQTWTTTTQEKVDLTEGEHTLRINIESNQGININYITVSSVITAGSSINQDVGAFNFYPNPAADQITFSESTAYSIIDITGRIIQSGNGNSAQLHSLQEGLYLLRTHYGTFELIIE